MTEFKQYKLKPIEQIPPITPTNIKDLSGLIETVSVVPTGTPSRFDRQIKLYINGATLRLYIYSNVDNTWHYITISA